MDILKFMGEHPFLTFFLAYLLALLIESVVKTICVTINNRTIKDNNAIKDTDDD